MQSDDEVTKSAAPVWTLITEKTALPTGDYWDQESMTSARLTELRTALAAFAGSPIAMLERHPIPHDLDRGRGLRLDSSSPLAKYFSDLVEQAKKSGGPEAGGEALYRMVVPAKFAADLGAGLIPPMASKAVAGGK